MSENASRESQVGMRNTEEWANETCNADGKSPRGYKMFSSRNPLEGFYRYIHSN
jgi:hypothetical protein